MDLPIVDSKLQQVADSLEKAGQIGMWRQKRGPIYVQLRSSHLFNRLVSLYTRAFRYQWRHFKHLAESFNIEDSTAIAICYVSAWFIDLYVSNRKCVNKISPTAACDHFLTEKFHMTGCYDVFLRHLNAVIRPTQLVNALADAVYIPLIANTVDWTCNNPFGIKDFQLDEDLFRAIVDAMRSGSWSMSIFANDTYGCPSWLFDWKSDKAYSWFPFKGNFGHDDLVIPYILGIPCSPRLASCDADEWQYFPGGNLPDNVQVQDYVRLTNRSFYGSAEYRTIEYELHTMKWPTTCSARSGTKRANVETGFSSPSAQEVTVSFTAYRYKLIDWTYHYRVILEINSQIQDDLFYKLLFRGLN